MPDTLAVTIPFPAAMSAIPPQCAAVAAEVQRLTTATLVHAIKHADHRSCGQIPFADRPILRACEKHLLASFRVRVQLQTVDGVGVGIRGAASL